MAAEKPFVGPCNGCDGVCHGKRRDATKPSKSAIQFRLLALLGRAFAGAIGCRYFADMTG
jgi:hypothetical protein